MSYELKKRILRKKVMPFLIEDFSEIRGRMKKLTMHG